mmetsp:Transcript_51231/g.166043  ORF Transcript_51231/g.166043 Transcript_51231/m.166043 type:complete len:549 (-) Transcript_51231:203-1849(-)
MSVSSLLDRYGRDWVSFGDREPIATDRTDRTDRTEAPTTRETPMFVPISTEGTASVGTTATTSVAQWSVSPEVSSTVKHHPMVGISPFDLQLNLGTCDDASERYVRPESTALPFRLNEWSVENVAQWVASTPLPAEVQHVLRSNAINGPVLESLTEMDLVAMGIDKFGWRRQLLLSRQDLFLQLEARRRPPEWAEMYERSTACTPLDSPRGLSNPPRGHGTVSGPSSVSVQTHRNPLPAAIASDSTQCGSDQMVNLFGAQVLSQGCDGAGPLPHTLPNSQSPGTSHVSPAFGAERVFIRPPQHSSNSRTTRSPSPGVPLSSHGLSPKACVPQHMLAAGSRRARSPFGVAVTPHTPAPGMAWLGPPVSPASPQLLLHQVKPPTSSSLTTQPRVVCQGRPAWGHLSVPHRRSPSPPHVATVVVQPPRAVSPSRVARPKSPTGLRTASPAVLRRVASPAGIRSLSPPMDSTLPAAPAWLSWPPRPAVPGGSVGPSGGSVARPWRCNSTNCMATVASVASTTKLVGVGSLSACPSQADGFAVNFTDSRPRAN